MSKYNLPFQALVELIYSTINKPECGASDRCKDDILTLLAMLSCVSDMDQFDQKAYAYYRGLIDKWISSYSGRIFIHGQSTSEVIQRREFSQNLSLAEMIFGLIPAFKKVIYDRFRFVPSETVREQTFSEATVTRHHGKNKSRPIPLRSFMGTIVTTTPTTSGIAFATVAKA
jgi:hypothetical protein